jgi:hypothetical protein
MGEKAMTIDIEQIKRDHELVMSLNYGEAVGVHIFREVLERESALLAHIERLESEVESLKNECYEHGAHRYLAEERLSAMASQHKCGCGHPACNRCADDALNREALETNKVENDEA